VQEHHVAVLLVDAIEHFPDQAVVLVVCAAGEGDAGSRWD
jgi:hypothetical protein